jgi:hypothetical protein
MQRAQKIAKVLTNKFGRFSAPLFWRGWGRLGGFLLLMFFSFYAQAQSVTIPNPDWPLDSVINGAAHRYTVPGDPNYDEPSDFVWTVEGGRLFYDENLTQPAPAVFTDTVAGDANNITTMWVVWDSFDQPLDTGYVYVYEISSNGCELADDNPDKYVGMRIKVSAPPDVYFLVNETHACSYDEGVVLDVVIEGMPPFDLTYRINDSIITRHILPEDLFDSDLDGEENNVTIVIDNFTGTDVDIIYELELLEASSGGVEGNILEFPDHTVYVYRRPDAPRILRDLLQVTVSSRHSYLLLDSGTDPAEFFWELVDSLGNIHFEYSSLSQTFVQVPFDVPPGDYHLRAFYRSENGCFSHADSILIEVFEVPHIMFNDEGDITACSEVSVTPDEIFEFIVQYSGALTYEFTYDLFEVIDGVEYRVWDEPVTMDYLTERLTTITIPNTFINDTEDNKVWIVRIIRAVNEEGFDVEIDAVDGERKMIIHPKPFIEGGIEFYN